MLVFLPKNSARKALIFFFFFPLPELTIHDKRNIAQMSLALMLGCRKKEQWTAGFEIISVLVREDIKLYWLASNQQLTECEILYAMLHVCIRSGHQIEAGKLLIGKYPGP